MSKPRKILVAGIGNIFLGDDGFGSEVARRLITEELPSEVEVADFGIRSYDLAYAMMDGYDVTILVDATTQGQPPGTVYLIEPNLSELDQLEPGTTDAHMMDPKAAFRFVNAFGGAAGKFYMVGCEPAILDAADGRIGLSEQVTAAVPRAIALLKSLLADLLK
jgi:hydrogenase maturation protease